MKHPRSARHLTSLTHRRVAGLEIAAGHLRVAYGAGDTAVTAESTPPAMALEDGHVANPQELAAAVRDLWASSGIRTRDVVMGIASGDVVTRQVEMPMLDDGDLRSALRFELADMVPFPIADCVIRFRRIDDLSEDRATPHVRLLAVVALSDTLRSYLQVAQDAGLRVRNIDLSTFALARAAASRQPFDGPEGVVAVASDGLSVVIHHRGSVRFARSIATQLGAAGSGELESELALIEQYRRRGSTSAPGAATRTDPVVEAIRGTLEYASTQQGATQLDQLVICGDDLAERVRPQLAADLSLPVIPLEPDSSRSRFAVAYGLTLPGDDAAAGPRPLGLLPDRQRADGPRSLIRRGGLAAAGAAVIVGAISMTAGPDVSSAQHAEQHSADQVAVLQRRLRGLSADSAAALDLANRTSRLERVADQATDWAGFAEEIRRAAPPGATVSSITGDGPSTSKSGKHLPGSLRLVATAPSQTAVSDWMDAIGRIDGLETPWLSSLSGDGGRAQAGTAFTLTVAFDRASR